MCYLPSQQTISHLNNSPLSKQLSARPQSPTSTMSLSARLSPAPVSPLSSSFVEKSSRVSFADNTTIISTLPPSSSMSQEERCATWYDANDLNDFKSDARTLCRQLRENANLYHMQECVRGLEQRISLERQRNKCLTLRCILKAQLRYPDKPEQLANIAAKCTAWAQQVAQTAAQQDFQQVYDAGSSDESVPMSSQQQLLLLATPSTPLVAFPLNAFHLKRQCSIEADEDEISTSSTQQRNVRPRVQ